MNNPITIAISGGPCSGKTTSLVDVSDALVKIGKIPFVIPEAATLLISAGITPWGFKNPAEFQTHLYSGQHLGITFELIGLAS